MSGTLVVVQSSYIPWKGYFDLINGADWVVLLDDVQFTRRDWRNRNRVKTPLGPMWLTIPVRVKGRYHQRICEAEATDDRWRAEHWRALQHNYARAPHYPELRDRVAGLYLGSRERNLSRINGEFLRAVCDWLGIRTSLSWSMDYELAPGQSGRLLDLCQKLGATTYLSGPSAKAYLDEPLFRESGVHVRYMEYEGYPEYPQLFPPFDHHVSILDLLFNTGAGAPAFMKSFERSSPGLAGRRAARPFIPGEAR